MLILKDLLNGLAFIISIVLIVYGFVKGYDLIEILIYYLYLTVVIITLLINLFDK